jgi:hypothetical protein
MLIWTLTHDRAWMTSASLYDLGGESLMRGTREVWLRMMSQDDGGVQMVTPRRGSRRRSLRAKRTMLPLPGVWRDGELSEHDGHLIWGTLLSGLCVRLEVEDVLGKGMFKTAYATSVPSLVLTVASIPHRAYPRGMLRFRVENDPHVHWMEILLARALSRRMEGGVNAPSSVVLVDASTEREERMLLGALWPMRSMTLGDILTGDADRDVVWWALTEIGRLLRRMHGLGCAHGDPHWNNFFWDGARSVWVHDLGRSVWVDPGWRHAGLTRLMASRDGVVEKNGGGDEDIPESVRAWRRSSMWDAELDEMQRSMGVDGFESWWEFLRVNDLLLVALSMRRLWPSSRKIPVGRFWRAMMVGYGPLPKSRSWLERASGVDGYLSLASMQSLFVRYGHGGADVSWHRELLGVSEDAWRVWRGDVEDGSVVQSMVDEVVEVGERGVSCTTMVLSLRELVPRWRLVKRLRAMDRALAERVWSLSVGSYGGTLSWLRGLMMVRSMYEDWMMCVDGGGGGEVMWMETAWNGGRGLDVRWRLRMLDRRRSERAVAVGSVLVADDVCVR